MLRFIYSLLKSTIRFFGYELFVIKKDVQILTEYERLFPKASYAPWNCNEQFKRIYEAARPFTLVDKYRCYELWLLVEESKKSQGAFLEVGTWRGGSGAIIASHAQQLGLTEKVYLCDTFKGVVKTGEKDSSYYGGEHADTSYSTVSALMKKLNLKNVEILEGVFPDETGVHIEDEVFRFCHIDVDVYLSAKEIIEWVWPRLSNGGIVVFDDYGFKTCDGITRFVNEESKSLDRRFVYNLNGHSIWIKVP